MAVNAQDSAQLAPANHKELKRLGHELGTSDPTVKLVTYEPEEEIIAVYVDAAEDKSEHERGPIRVWLGWLPKVDDRLEFKLFNLSEIASEASRSRLMAAYQGEILFDRR